MTRHQQISKALTLLDLPQGEREKWREDIDTEMTYAENRLAINEDQTAVRSKRTKVALKRHLAALRRVRVTNARLDKLIRQQLSLTPPIIARDIEKTEEALLQPSRRGRTLAAKHRAGVMMAYMLL